MRLERRPHVPLLFATLSPVAAVAVALLLAGWGLVGTAAPVAWWMWLGKVLPDDAEPGGGLMVGVIQLAIAIGATVGGVLYDAAGHRGTFAASASVLCASALVAAKAARDARRP